MIPTFTSDDFTRWQCWLSAKETDPPGEPTEAAIDLYSALEGDFLPVGRELEISVSPAGLTLFQVKKEIFFAVASTDGKLVLGKLNRERGPELSNSMLRMHGFDPRTDEVLSVFSLSPGLSPRTSVYVVVRHWPSGGEDHSVRLFHASVFLRDGQIHAEPSRDDADKTPVGEWVPVALDSAEIPDWLGRCTLAFPLGHKPMADPPDDLPVQEDRLPRTDGRLLSAAWTGEELLLGTDNDRLLGAKEPVPLEQSPLCLAVSQRCEEGSRFVVVGGHDQTLQGLVLRDKEFVWFQNESWTKCRFLLLSRAVGIGMLPPAENEWPDLVVATQNGVLVHLAHAERESLLVLWSDLSEQIGKDNDLKTLGLWIRWADGRIREDPRRHLEGRSLRAITAMILDRAFNGPAPDRADMDLLAGFLGSSSLAGDSPWLGTQLAMRAKEWLALVIVSAMSPH